VARPAEFRLFRRRAGKAQGDFNGVGNLVLKLAGHDVEIAALDGEAGAVRISVSCRVV
jgi:hypothetical protein